MLQKLSDGWVPYESHVETVIHPAGRVTATDRFRRDSDTANFFFSPAPNREPDIPANGPAVTRTISPVLADIIGSSGYGEAISLRIQSISVSSIGVACLPAPTIRMTPLILYSLGPDC